MHTTVVVGMAHAVGGGVITLGLVALAVAGLLVANWMAEGRPSSSRSSSRSRTSSRSTSSRSTAPSQVSAGAGATADRDETQARAVRVWAGQSSPKVLVANSSPFAVHEVRAFVALGRRRPEMVGWVRELPPTSDEGARIALTAQGRESWIRWIRDSKGARQGVSVECTFRDARDQFWRLDRHGEVHPIDADEALGEPRRR
ncbi:hypothetical protein IEQ44_03805 [Nocardioides sp. Y6]|uniref:Secreted protein n=1 Tax=Nocardioides malaquae TaxID=2773426 RepID=A0ABR9RQC6_9ACTN|nr:hypothetical protein [Nocardioides malaquae]MBE7323773.1 hypothetical protein [Nocardioides malaquae]